MILVILTRNLISLVNLRSDFNDSDDFDEKFGKSCDFEIGFK